MDWLECNLGACAGRQSLCWQVRSSLCILVMQICMASALVIQLTSLQALLCLQLHLNCCLLQAPLLMHHLYAEIHVFELEHAIIFSCLPHSWQSLIPMPHEGPDQVIPVPTDSEWGLAQCMSTWQSTPLLPLGAAWPLQTTCVGLSCILLHRCLMAYCCCGFKLPFTQQQYMQCPAATGLAYTRF